MLPFRIRRLLPEEELLYFAEESDPYYEYFPESYVASGRPEEVVSRVDFVAIQLGRPIATGYCYPLLIEGGLQHAHRHWLELELPWEEGDYVTGISLLNTDLLGKRLGPFLIQSWVKYLRESEPDLSIKRLIASVSPGNERSLRMLRSMGFIKAGDFSQGGILEEIVLLLSVDDLNSDQKRD